MMTNAARSIPWPSLATYTIGAGNQFSITPQAIPDVLLIAAKRHADTRGTLMETYRSSDFEDLGLPVFCQENATRSHGRGTLRGLHFQRPPVAQATLIRPIRGSIFNVCVDLRRGSSTYGRAIGVTMTAASAEMLYVPPGFAQGYCTMTDDTEVTYKFNAYYTPEAEGGINFADAALGIDWPFPPNELVVSDRDRALPRLGQLASPFVMER